MIIDQLRLATKNIKEKGARSWLTIIGIFIGIAAVVALISLTQGLTESVEAEFEAIGTDTITVLAGGAGGVDGFGPAGAIGQYIDEDDVDVILEVDGVKNAESMTMNRAEVEYRDRKEMAFVLGTTTEIFEVFPQFDIDRGREFRAGERNSAILGSNFGPRVFDEEIELRENLEIREERVRVIGMLESVGTPLYDRGLILPIETSQDIFDADGKVSAVYVNTLDGYDPAEVAQEIEEELEDARDDDDFSVQTMEQVLEAVNNILGMVQALFVGVAAISLFVGGVGIMSTMYTSVLEKTRDIGIMKAVGARNENIMTIFLFESGLLGLAGGVLGVVIGLSLAKGAEYAFHEYLGISMLRVAVNPELVVGALAFSFVVGTLSGILPARRAAKLDPVDALRSE